MLSLEHMPGGCKIRFSSWLCGADELSNHQIHSLTYSLSVSPPFLLFEKDTGRDRLKLAAQKSVGKGSGRALRQGSVGSASCGECNVWAAVFHSYQSLPLRAVKLHFSLMSSLALEHQLESRLAQLS